MKKIFQMLFGVICAMFLFGQINAYAYDANADRSWHKRHMHDAHTNVSDTLLKNNGQVHPFLPGDTRGGSGTSKTCNSEGRYVDDGRTLSNCYDYHSAEANTSWRIRYIDYGTDHSVPPGDWVVAQIFKVQKNGGLSLWASFNGHREKVYASSDAQKFADAKGPSNTEVAGSTDPTKSVEEQTPQMNPSDILKKGLGAVFKGGRFGF